MIKGQRLPIGQRERKDFPRFGLPPFANKFPTNTTEISLAIGGLATAQTINADQFSTLEQIEQTSDFHCVTTWSHGNLNWRGYRFSDVFNTLIKPLARPQEHASYVTLYGQDSYRTCMLLQDLMADDVILAYQLNGKPLSVEHGAPFRLVAPAHYGYKNVKHICQINFCSEFKNYRPGLTKFLDHPRARVQYEERGNIFPGSLLRFLYRLLINRTVNRFAKAMSSYKESAKHKGAEKN